MMSASKYFRALLGPYFKEGHDNEVIISNIDGPTLNLIINYCYSGKIQITDDNIMEIVSAASAMELVLLRCDMIHAKEELIFQRLVQWVDYDEENRSKYVPDLLKLIRLEKIRKPVC